MIKGKNIRFSYDGDTFALDGITLDIAPGEFVCIVGGNGSGKSTLAKHFNALLVPDEGDVWVLGHNTKDKQATYYIRSNAGMVFQSPDDQLIANLIENDVAFGPENLGVPSDELRTRVTDALISVGLQGFEQHETSALSGGQKQRVAIAGVLAMQPRILIFDEATAMLDPRGRKGLMRICHHLHDAGMTIVMITHFMDEAAEADRLIVLEKGSVVYEGSPQEVLTQEDLLEHVNLDMPFASTLSKALQRRGVSVGTHVETSPLKEELCALILKG